MFNIQGVPKKRLLRIFSTYGMIFPKTDFVYPTFKKEISILSRIVKKLQACQYLQNCLYVVIAARDV